MVDRRINATYCGCQNWGLGRARIARTNKTAEGSKNTNKNTHNKQRGGTACLAAEAVSAKSGGVPVEVRGDVRAYPWPFRQPGFDFGRKRIGTHPRMAEGPGVAERSGASPGIPQAVAGKQLTKTHTKHAGWPPVATLRSPLRPALLYKLGYVDLGFQCVAFALNSNRPTSATPPTRFAAKTLSGQCPMHAVSVWISLYSFPPSIYGKIELQSQARQGISVAWRYGQRLRQSVEERRCLPQGLSSTDLVGWRELPDERHLWARRSAGCSTAHGSSMAVHTADRRGGQEGSRQGMKC